MKRRSFIMLLCAIVVMSSAAFGTIAYLTDSRSLTNTFTVGNVAITLDEARTDPSGAPVDADGNPVGENGTPARTQEGNQYKLIPGSTYTKDPTVTVKAGSESSYVRMLVTLDKAAELDAIYAALHAADALTYGSETFLPSFFVDGWDSTIWPCVSMVKDAAANTYTLVFNYKDIVTVGAQEDAQLPALFTAIRIPGLLSGEQLNSIANLSASVTAQAIQNNTFDSAQAAWQSFEGQNATPLPPEEVPPITN